MKAIKAEYLIDEKEKGYIRFVYLKDGVKCQRIKDINLNVFLDILNLNYKGKQDSKDFNEIIDYIKTSSKNIYTDDETIILRIKRYIDKCIEDPNYANYELFNKSHYTGKVRQPTYSRIIPLKEASRKNAEKEEKASYKSTLIHKNDRDHIGKEIAVFELKTLEDFLSAFLLESFDKKKKFGRCENCGKYFLTSQNKKYCNYPSPQKPQQTCAMYCKKENWKNNRKNNRAYDLKIKINDALRKRIETINKKENITKEDKELIKSHKSKLAEFNSLYETYSELKKNDEITESQLIEILENYKRKEIGR